MANPTKDEVRVETILIVSTFTTLEPNQLEDEFVLRDPPMIIDNIGLAFLAATLRGYVKQYQRGATVRARDLRKSKLTVAKTVALVQNRVGAT